MSIELDSLSSNSEENISLPVLIDTKSAKDSEGDTSLPIYIGDGKPFSESSSVSEEDVSLPTFTDSPDQNDTLPLYVVIYEGSEKSCSAAGTLPLGPDLNDDTSTSIPQQPYLCNDTSTPISTSQLHVSSESANTSKTNGLKRFTPPSTSTPKKKRLRIQDDYSPPDNLPVSDESVLQMWTLSCIVNLDGCAPKCAMSEHGLNEHDILAYHHSFDRKSPTKQNQWLIQYFATHCPSNSEGGKDFKSMLYIVQGKKVCANLWQEVLCLSVARYYRLRRQFLDFGDTTSAAKEKRRSLAPKTREAVAWRNIILKGLGINAQIKMLFCCEHA